MDQYVCKRCDYVTNQKGNLLRHLNRKKSCVVTKEAIDVSVLLSELEEKEENNKEHECKDCGKKFAYASNLSRHKKTCAKKLKTTEKEFEDLKIEYEKLKKQLDKNSVTNSITNNITNNNTMNNNITINIGNFCNEKIDHIDPEFIMECLKDMDMVKLLEQIHFDPQHPENHTVRIKNINKNLMEYHEEGRWLVGKKDKVLEDMINCSGFRVLRTFYRENKRNVHEEIIEAEGSRFNGQMLIDEITDWLTKIDKEDEKIFKGLKSDIFLLVLNNKAMVCGK